MENNKNKCVQEYSKKIEKIKQQQSIRLKNNNKKKLKNKIKPTATTTMNNK